MFDLGRGFLATAAREPDRVALSDGETRLTWRQWERTTLGLAGGLRRFGLEPGDHVVTLLTNRHEAATLHVACQLAGLVITPLNWRASADEIDHVLEDADARVLVHEPLVARQVSACSRGGGVRLVGLDGATGTPWASLCDGPAGPPAASPDDTSVMLYTSGTTGRGKGVPRSHRAERAAAVAHVAQNLYRPGEVVLGVMPLYHTMGVRSLLASIIVSGHFVCQRRFDPAGALALIERERVSALYLVPTLYHDLLEAPGFAATDITSVRRLGFAGQTMTDGLVARLDAAFRPELFVNHYGSSEIYTFTVETDAAGKPGSAGKAGINQEIRVVDLDHPDPGRPVAAGVEGQIIAALDGDEAFGGYWKRPDADAVALRDGWYFTGDIGYRDHDGDLFVTGRVDDMIISGGENILPAEIESVLSLHPDVGEVAVAGMPHARWGSQVTAFLTRTGPVDADTLDRWCRESGLADFKRPRQYVFVAAVPKSPVGKILRRLLVAGDWQPETGEHE